MGLKSSRYSIESMASGNGMNRVKEYALRHVFIQRDIQRELGVCQVSQRERVYIYPDTITYEPGGEAEDRIYVIHVIREPSGAVISEDIFNFTGQDLEEIEEDEREDIIAGGEDSKRELQEVMSILDDHIEAFTSEEHRVIMRNLVNVYNRL